MTSIQLFLLVVPILSLLLLSINFILAPHNPYKEKTTPFECGYHSFLAQNRLPFTISYFIFGILFLIFDIEIASLFPWTVSSNFNREYGFFIAMLFILILALGFVYELGKNALKFDSKQNTNGKGSVSFTSLAIKSDFNYFLIYLISKIKHKVRNLIIKFYENNLYNFLYIHLIKNIDIFVKLKTVIYQYALFILRVFIKHPNKTMSFFVFNLFLAITVYYSEDLFLYLTFLVYMLDGFMLVYFIFINNNLINKHPVIYYILVGTLSIVFVISLVILIKFMIYFCVGSIKLLFKIWSNLSQKATTSNKKDIFYEEEKTINKNISFYGEGGIYGRWKTTRESKPANYGSKGAGKSQEEKDLEWEALDPETKRKKEYQRDYYQRKKREREENPELDKAFKQNQRDANKRYKLKNEDNPVFQERKSLYNKDELERKTPEQRTERNKKSRDTFINKIKKEDKYDEYLYNVNQIRKERFKSIKDNINTRRRNYHERNKEHINKKLREWRKRKKDE